VFSVGDRFAFDNPQSAEAFEYLVRLINTDHVAPPASDTNDNGDFSRNQFLQPMALFQSAPQPAAIADCAVPVGRGDVRAEGPRQRHERHRRRR
jgi:multiple sugar transport system substrate-binding protein